MPTIGNIYGLRTKRKFNGMGDKQRKKGRSEEQALLRYKNCGYFSTYHTL